MIKNGTRLQSQVCDTQVIVVRTLDAALSGRQRDGQALRRRGWRGSPRHEGGRRDTLDRRYAVESQGSQATAGQRLTGQSSRDSRQRALIHNRSTISIARSGALPLPTKVLSCVSVIVVVAARVRTSPGRSSEMGRASASCSTSVTILFITES